MAATKARTSIWSAQTLTAGAADTLSGWQDVSTGYGVNVSIKLTNGGTGPTIAAQVQVEVANDSGHTLIVSDAGPLVGSLTASAVSSWAVSLGIEVAYFRLRAGSNTGQNVTVDADYSNVTGI